MMPLEKRNLPWIIGTPVAVLLVIALAYFLS
jgi:hypothetical protein